MFILHIFSYIKLYCHWLTDTMGSDTNITDISRLHRVLVDRGLRFRVGKEKTPADGNCYLWSCLQAHSQILK